MKLTYFFIFMTKIFVSAIAMDVANQELNISNKMLESLKSYAQQFESLKKSLKPQDTDEVLSKKQTELEELQKKFQLFCKQNQFFRKYNLNESQTQILTEQLNKIINLSNGISSDIALIKLENINMALTKLRENILTYLNITPQEKQSLLKKLLGIRNFKTLQLSLFGLIKKYKLGLSSWLRPKGASFRLLFKHNWGDFMPEPYRDELAFFQGNRNIHSLQNLSIDSFWAFVKAGRVPISESDMLKITEENNLRGYGSNPENLNENTNLCNSIAKVWVKNLFGEKSFSVKAWIEKNLPKLASRWKMAKIKSLENYNFDHDPKKRAMPVNLQNSISDEIKKIISASRQKK